MIHPAPKKPIKPIYHVLTFFTWAGIAIWILAAGPWSEAVTPTKAEAAAPFKGPSTVRVLSLSQSWYGTDLRVDFEVRNDSDDYISNMKVTCTANGETVTRKDSTIQEHMNPHTTMTIPVMLKSRLWGVTEPQACAITGWEVLWHGNL